MNNLRVICRLDVKGPNLVKGIHLEGLRVLGKPADFAKYYYEGGADELMFVDVVASLYERNSLHDIVRDTARDIFVPITVAGGLRTLDDIRSVLRAGADKVAINTAAVRNSSFIASAAKEFGNSTIVGTIECIRQSDGRYLAFVDNGREETGLEVCEWAQRLQDLGVGEIVVTSVDREGTGQGYDVALTEAVARSVTIPVIAHGGAGSASHVVECALGAQVSAVAVASLFHNDFLQRAYDGSVAISPKDFEGNREFLKKRGFLAKVEAVSVAGVKRALRDAGVPCRFDGDEKQ